MTLKAFTIYDSKANFYIPPFVAKTVGEAIRDFSDTVADSNTKLYWHSADYTLFEVGEFDSLSGRLTMLPAFVSHGNGAEFKSKITEATLNDAQPQ